MAAKFTGALTFDNESVRNEHFSSNTTYALDADKMQHIYHAGTNFGLEYNATPAAKVFVVYVATAAGTIRGFHGMLYDSGTSTSITFDLKKNGTTVLSSPITIVHGDGDRTVLDGTLSVTTFATDDVFTVHLATSSTTGAQGPYAWAMFEEATAGS